MYEKLFLQNIKGLKRVRGQTTGQCPLHEDKRASFSVDLDTGLWMCHAGCGSGNARQFAERLGIPFEQGDPDKEVLAVYQYHNEQGNLLFETIRYASKRFSVRDATGRPGLQGARKVLYRLPQLVKADPVQMVFIPEGEKDVNTLAKLGLVATTNPFGAGKWQSDFNQYLRNRSVVILPDNDSEGIKHGQQVASNLLPVAREVRILKLPGLAEKGDISDWLRKGHTKEQLLQLATVTPSQVLSVCDGMTVQRLHDLDEPEPMEFVVEDFVPKDYPSLVFGDGGQGKSLIVLHLATCVAMGKDFLGRTVVRGNVLYVDFELDETEQARRAYRVARGLELIRPPEGLLYFSPQKQDKPVADFNSIIKDLAVTIEKEKVILTIIDSFGAAVTGDPESAKDVTSLFRELRSLGTVVVVDHQAKRIGSERYKDKTAFGSVYKSNLSRNIWQLERRLSDSSPENEVKMAFHHHKSNFGPLRKTICLKATFGQTFTLEEIEADEDFGDALSPKDQVLVTFKDLGEVTAEEVTNEMVSKGIKIALKTVQNKVTELLKEGKLTDTGGKRGQAHLYRASVPASRTLSGRDREDAFKGKAEASLEGRDRERDGSQDMKLEIEKQFGATQEIPDGAPF